MQDNTSPSLKIFIILQSLILVPWLGISPFLVMVFDAPGSVNNNNIWFFVLLIWTYPIYFLAIVIIAQIINTKGHYKFAKIIIMLPTYIFISPYLILILSSFFLE